MRIALYQASQWRQSAPRVPIEDILGDSHIGRYLSDWGRPGDAAFIAEVSVSRSVGAAWCRRFTLAEPGYGFVDPLTPELSIAVLPDYRGQGIGEALIAALIAEARARGYPALSLSVEKDNPASRLYERLDFVRVGAVSGSWTMRLDLSE
jgi:ribosomal protein S18 acetylase RimI-like enzyme